MDPIGFVRARVCPTYEVGEYSFAKRCKTLGRDPETKG